MPLGKKRQFNIPKSVWQATITCHHAEQRDVVIQPIRHAEFISASHKTCRNEILKRVQDDVLRVQDDIFPQVRHCERSATGTERSNLICFSRHCERSEAISWFLKIATDSKCHCPRNDEECLLHFRKIYKGAVRPRNDGKRKAVVVC